jgi:flagellar basal-body rod protein FlgF
MLGYGGEEILGSVAELGTVMMQAAQRRIDVAAGNLSNVSTPSYRARRVFSHILDVRSPSPVDGMALARASVADGMKFTGGPFDVALSGGGAMLLRDQDQLVAVKSAQLRRDAEGRVVDVAGRILQAAGGGEIIIGAGVPSILQDGTILLDSQAVGRIGVFRVDEDVSVLSGLPDEIDNSVVRQGFLTASTVDPAAEMIELTKAGRIAETGARVFQIQDDLVGQVVRKLGEART